ncbi:uncharacterized protein [Channa argus]|uniref:uncharacterized protein n=1 Tax=Channa argus TaxID=215402 RepID=UPI003521FE4B
MNNTMSLPMLFVLLCLLVPWGCVVRANEGGESQLVNFLENKMQTLDPDTRADQSTEQKNTTLDIWMELRMLRDMVVEQKVEMRHMEARLKETEMQADEQKVDLILTKTTLEELKKDSTVIKERLKNSEKQGEDLKRENTDQKAQIEILRSRLDATERKMEELKVDLKNQAVKLLSTMARVAASENELQLLQPRIDNMEAQSTVQEVEVSALKERMNTTESAVDFLMKENSKVAFYAALKDSKHVGPYNTPTVLKFSKIFTNVGKAYSPTTGFFTAPVKGVCYFRFTVCSNTADNKLMAVQLFHNGKSIMFNVLGSIEDHFNYISNAVILELNIGDELHMVLPEDKLLYDDNNNQSTFSGFLLFVT